MALWETFFEHEAPHLRYQSPKGDGAHQGQTDGVSGKCVMFLIGNMSFPISVMPSGGGLPACAQER
jgi:hypothetical protein